MSLFFIVQHFSENLKPSRGYSCPLLSVYPQFLSHSTTMVPGVVWAGMLLVEEA